MITLKQFMELCDYRITEGSAYGWNCYGHDAYSLDSWNGDQNGHTLSVTFDTRTQEVYEIYVCDYERDRAYRLINPEYLEANREEAKERDVNANEAWDGVNFVDLEIEEDFIEKAEAIFAGREYDTRVQVQVEFSDDELLEYMKIAHDRDITFNQLIEIALREAIDQHRMLNDIHFTNTDNPIDFPVKKKKKGKK